MNDNIIDDIVNKEYHSILILTDDVNGYTEQYEGWGWDIISFGEGGSRVWLDDTQYITLINPEVRRNVKYESDWWWWWYDIGGLEFDTVYLDTDYLSLDEWNYCCSRVRTSKSKFRKFCAY